VIAIFFINEPVVRLIDEISGGNMRVYKNGKIIQPLELVKIVLGE
jgi:phosphoribosylaminoimidazole-succinocarboxamide synthase